MLRWLFKKGAVPAPGLSGLTLGKGEPKVQPRAESLLARQMERISAANAFDEKWYLNAYPDVANSALPPLVHYLMYGWKEGRDPSPDFSTQYYLQRYADVKAIGVNPLFHYVAIGRAQRRSTRPNPNEAPEIVPRIAVELDLDFYNHQAATSFQSALEAAEHYVNSGSEKGFDPHPQFKSLEYLEDNADVRSARINPYYHYLVAGRGEGRLPFRMDVPFEDYLHQRSVIAKKFDAEFYLASYSDVAKAGVDPLHHFLVAGWKEGRDPCSDFSTDFYIFAHRDIRDAGVNPYVHYLTEGFREGRVTRISDGWVPTSAVRAMVSTEFDPSYYLQCNADVRATGEDPLEHFLYFGWREFRDPTSWFSCAYYLQANEDVATSGLNPFYHYIAAGRAEGREFRHPGGWKAEHLQRLRPLETEIEEALRLQASEPQSRDIVDHIQAAIEASASTSKALMLCVSHDDYKRSVGGVQLCINVEEAAALSQGWAYLNIYPSTPIPALRSELDWSSISVEVTLNGRKLGPVVYGDLLEVLSGVADSFERRFLVVHSLLGHSAQAIAKLHARLMVHRSLFWVHDYFSLCPSFVLLRNGIEYCGAPPAASTACVLCRFGRERLGHSEQMQALFSEVRFDVVAPSRTALEVWRGSSTLPAETQIVLPHSEFEDVPGGQSEIAERAFQINVAFLGHPASHKGWHTFLRVLDDQEIPPQFDFSHFGAGVPAHKRARFVNVSVLDGDAGAMVSALRRERIDLVLLWSIWPETYSLVAHEALAAGCGIICNSQSGNIARIVNETGAGFVFENDADLIRALKDGTIIEYVKGSRKQPRPARNLKYSQMSLEILRGSEVREA